MTWIKNLIGKIGEYFTSRAAADARRALEYAAVAMPYIDMAATVVTRLTPTGVDEAAWNAVRARFPKVFDHSLTIEERKLYALGVATELFMARFPQLDTSVARAAIQMAYLEARTREKGVTP